MKIVLPGAIAIVLLCTVFYEVAPAQFYRDWQQSFASQPDIAGKAAENYLQLTPQGPHAGQLRLWLASYHMALRGPVLTRPKATVAPKPDSKIATVLPTIAPPSASVVRELPARPISPIANRHVLHEDEQQQKESHTVSGFYQTAQSLAATLAFIAAETAHQGPISFMAEFRNPVDTYDFVEQISYRASNVTIDPDRCAITYRWHESRDGKAASDQERSLKLRGATSVRVETADRSLGGINAAFGRLYPVRVQPHIYAVRLRQHDNPFGDVLYFQNEYLATRIGKAAYRALNLCNRETDSLVLNQ